MKPQNILLYKWNVQYKHYVTVCLWLSHRRWYHVSSDPVMTSSTSGSVCWNSKIIKIRFWHLSSHWLPEFIKLIWLGRFLPPWPLHIFSPKVACFIGEVDLHQIEMCHSSWEYSSSCSPLIELLTNSLICRNRGLLAFKSPSTSTWDTACGILSFFKKKWTYK